MKKFGIFTLGTLIGAIAMRFCMKNEKAQKFFSDLKKKGEGVIGKKENPEESKPE